MYGYDRLAADTAGWFAGTAERGVRLEIDFRFTERIASGELASERGFYRITARRAGDQDRTLYGLFHTFSRKRDGRWRIVADYDTDDGGTVTAAAFDAAVPLDECVIG